ncbi:toxic anion resistance protein [Staphylococcus hominis]|uniref:toxic anion resistance protein n=1 Tax=Staphylococcus hominis TaxID=1290 RepID=UPI003DA04CB2
MTEQTKNNQVDLLEKATPKNNEVDLMEGEKFSLAEADPEKVEKYKQLLVKTDIRSIQKYGNEAEKEHSRVPDALLDEKRTKSSNEVVGKQLKYLMETLENADPDKLAKQNSNIFKRWFKKAEQKVKDIRREMVTVQGRVDKIANELTRSERNIDESNRELDKLFELNRDYFNDISAYIEAGHIRKGELEQELETLQQKASETGHQEDIQAVSDMEEYIHQLDKRVYSLELSREVTRQTGSQIRMIQNTNQALAEQVNSSVNSVIPMWKNQIGIALQLKNQKDVVDTQKMVRDTAKTFMIKNSEMLHKNAVDIAKSNEEPMIDIEAVRKVNENTLKTIRDVLQIKEDSKRKIEDGRKTLAEIEEEHKRERDNLLSNHY